MKNHVKIIVNGAVQGVFFRAGAQKEARRLGVKGFVKNQPDGSVYIEAEGSVEPLKSFIKWCRSGPPSARVESIQTDNGPLVGYPSFTVRS